MLRTLFIGIVAVAATWIVVVTVYAASIESARDVVEASGNQGATHQALELVMERGATGYIGG
jgi:hypothetical protein